MSETQPRNLVKKLCEVMAAIERVPKTGYNEFHKYKYATEADIVELIRGELAKRHVFIFPSVKECTRSSHDVETMKWDDREKMKVPVIRKTQLTEVIVEWTFVCGDTGEERTITVNGVGEDNVDKGFYKAFTGSEKYMLMKSFLIPTGDDPERDSRDDLKDASKNGKDAAQALGSQKIKDLEAAKRAKQQGNGADLTKSLQDSITAAQAAKPASNGHGKPELLKEAVEAAKDDGLYDELSGTIQTVKQMQTSPAKGSRPYRKIVITTIVGGKLIDVDLSAFDNFKMSDGTCFAVLDADETIGATARFVVERNGKYVNLKDIKQLGRREWDARLGVIQCDAETKEKLW